MTVLQQDVINWNLENGVANYVHSCTLVLNFTNLQPTSDHSFDPHKVIKSTFWMHIVKMYNKL